VVERRFEKMNIAARVAQPAEVALIPSLASCREPRNLGRLRYLF
jgi:hypothetical protein